MPAVRARRPGRHPQEQQTKKRGRRPPPQPPQGVPRLAAIKMSGGLTGEEINVSGKSLALALAGLVLMGGASIAGAAFLGSSLFDVGEAFNRSADAAVSELGFGVSAIEVSGVSGARAAEVRAQIMPEGRHSLLALDPDDVRARIEGLGWVEHARVRRLWPSTLKVDVVRRQAYARWQENGAIAVIDSNGERLLAERAADHNELPLVVGKGAGPAAQPLLIALEELPQVRARLRALVRVGDRRWNVELTSGTRIALPQQDPQLALSTLEGLQVRHALLDRPVAEIDLRAPGRVAVRVHPQLAGGPTPPRGAQMNSSAEGV